MHPNWAFSILWLSKVEYSYGMSPGRLGFLLGIMKDATADGLLLLHNKCNKEMYLYKVEDYYLLHHGIAGLPRTKVTALTEYDDRKVNGQMRFVR